MLPVTFDSTNLSLPERFEVELALVDDMGVMSVFLHDVAASNNMP